MTLLQCGLLPLKKMFYIEEQECADKTNWTNCAEVSSHQGPSYTHNKFKRALETEVSELATSLQTLHQQASCSTSGLWMSAIQLPLAPI